MELISPCLPDSLSLQPLWHLPAVSLVRRKGKAGQGRRCSEKPHPPTGVGRGDGLSLEWASVASHHRDCCLLFSRVLYGNKITEIAKGLFDGLVSLQLL